MSDRPITARQQRFVQEYLVDLNLEQAALRAGYAPLTARHQASRLLSVVGIQLAIAEKQAVIAKKADVTVEWIVERYKRLADSDIRKFYDESGQLKSIADLDLDTAYALGGFEVEQRIVRGEEGEEVITSRVTKIKRIDPVKALEGLSRHLGMFKDAGPNVNVNITLAALVAASLKVDEK